MKNAELYIAVPVLNLLSLLYLAFGSHFGLDVDLEWIYLFPFLTYLMVPVTIILVLKYYRQNSSMIFSLGAMIGMLFLNKFLSVMIRKDLNDSYITLIQAMGLVFIVLEVVMIYQAQQLTIAKLKTWLTTYFSVSLGMSILNHILPRFLFLTVSSTQSLYLSLPIVSDVVFLLFVLQLPSIQLEEEAETQNPEDLLTRRDAE